MVKVRKPSRSKKARIKTKPGQQRNSDVKYESPKDQLNSPLDEQEPTDQAPQRVNQEWSNLTTEFSESLRELLSSNMEAVSMGISNSTRSQRISRLFLEELVESLVQELTTVRIPSFGPNTSLSVGDLEEINVNLKSNLSANLEQLTKLESELHTQESLYQQDLEYFQEFEESITKEIKEMERKSKGLKLNLTEESDFAIHKRPSEHKSIYSVNQDKQLKNVRQQLSKHVNSIESNVSQLYDLVENVERLSNLIDIIGI
ncbi:Hypothetical protein PP7435_CHR1-1248 [Komagataella phaffii CBS 7435]|uniref:Uncharacterized protein n=2 Tax=Komagataella phaffii TaxID=460519 RepID=C4QYI1_KOMPG|nr:Hypothetical protein PAS_chr1-4_0453 [Komagataella phaffii GS115]AOA60504.1 GQ67_01704T0 [Komagataella phaffii]CAH2447127.1 Hypothetical protein BQ9382_C1-6550 [Komagataella phaffii CBS 7435]CAY68304.1 Hypothetical protein PAS_chr1-4_0453 [Komagataella phaffii GS115]CCA37372.1 Hypothetical protein PP7435_CHR1-1248 [Komagataella phaffii CBS 7435]